MRTNNWMVIASLLVSGCVADGDPGATGDETTSETEQDVTGVMYPWWTGDSSQGEQWDLGSSADKTCFLMGVRGSLRGWTTWDSTVYTTASAGVINLNGHWIVRTTPGSGGGVAVKPGCIMTVANRVTIGATFDPGANSGSVPATANRQCFITAITGHGHGWSALLPEQPNNPPGVGLLSDGINWRFFGTLIENEETWSGSAGAVCVDVPNAGALTFTVTGDASRRLTGTDGMTCGLQSINGVFDDAVTAPGIELFHSGTPTWDLSAGAHYIAKARCIH